MDAGAPRTANRFSYLTSEIDAAYHHAAQLFGLSDSAMYILYTVCLHGTECPLSDVIRLSGISKQTINSALRKLETQGIVRLENAKGRKKKVCLTEAGVLLAGGSARQVLALEDDILSAWTEEERQIYFDLTARFLAAFKGKLKEIGG